jgi:Protein of unknown function (DUF1153)
VSETQLPPKAKYLIRRDGSLLTLGDLPCPKTKRWVIRRKADVVDAVHGGLITVQEACLRYSLTLEEFFAWRSAVDHFGIEALSATRAQSYRRAAKQNGMLHGLKRDPRESRRESANPPPGVQRQTTSSEMVSKNSG